MGDKEAEQSQQTKLLHHVLAEYMRRRDAGESIDIESICAAHPDLADALRSYAAGEGLLEAVAGDTPRAVIESDRSQAAETIRPGAAKQTDLAPNTMLGRYRIIRRLGEGAMGYVYLAEHTHLGREVALKIPKFTGLEGPDFRQRFTREARAAAQLDHPNICRVYDADEINGTPCIAMEYIPGQPLARFVGTAEFKDQRRVAEAVCGIAAGLAHAHQQGILHRDLKPGNVLMKGDSIPCVTDFGLARRVDSGDESHLTHEGDILGTPAYMSPEQIEAKANGVGPAADIYALGVVLYELLAGRTPFQGAVMSVLAQAMRDRPTPLAKVRPDVDPKLSDLCLRMLEKSPADRPQSMQEVIDLLQRWLKETSPETKAAQAKAKQSSERLAETKSKILDLIKRGQFAAASASLEKLLEQKSPEAAEQVAWAREKLAQVKKLPKQLKESMPVLLKMAKESIQRHDYAQAAQLLQEFPPDFRSDEVQRVLDQAIELQDESDLLLADLQECVRKKQFQGIEENLQRFLQLRPGNEFARKLRYSLETYSKVPLKQRVYRYDERGRLLPCRSGNLWDGWLLWGTLCFVAVFGLMTWAMVIYLKDGDRTLAVEVDETWLKEQGGQLTLAVDGKSHILIGPGFEIKVAFGERGFTVKNGDTVVHDPQTFTIEKQGRQVLRIDATGMRLSNADIAESRPTVPVNAESPSEIIVDAPATPLPDGPPGLVKALEGHKGGTSAVVWSGDGRSLVSTNGIDGLTRVWDVESGATRHQFKSLFGYGLAMHPNGDYVAAASPWHPDHLSISIYDVNTGEKVAESPEFETKPWLSGEFSPDGKYLAVHCRMNGGIKVFDVSQLPKIALAAQLPGGESGWATSLAFLPDGNRLIASASGTEYGIQLFDVASGKRIRSYHEKSGAPGSNNMQRIPIHADGSTFCVRSDKTWRLTQFDVGVEGETRDLGDGATCAAYSPSGKHLICTTNTKAGSGLLRVINAHSGKFVWEAHIETMQPSALDVSPDGRYVAVCGSVTDAAGTLLREKPTPLEIWRLPKEVWPKLKSATPLAVTQLPSAPVLKDSWKSSSGPELVWCPPGKFRMGSGETPLPDADETPVDVTLSQGLWVAKREVTQAQWKAVMGTEPWKAFQDHRDGANHAASHVTWIESVEFCRKLTETERQAGTIPADWEFRLPTEAEWEYFARAATTTRYSFGDDSKLLSEHAWWRDNADAKGEKYAHEVGQFKPNPWGLHDIHGNVYEWCQDSFVMLLRGGTNPLVNDPKIDNRVNRGGGWDGRDELAHTSSNRRWTPQNERRNNLGLRVVLGHLLKTPTVSQASPPAENAPAPTRLYVAQHAVDGPRNGRSWQSAYQDIQDALQELRRSKGAIKEVWIADGLYKPSPKGGSRDASYDLVGGVAYRGGFKGNETELSQRKSSLWTTKTRLSADLNGDDKGYFDNRGDNSHRIVQVVKQPGAVTLDMLRLEHATNTRPHRSRTETSASGGAVYVEGSTLIMRDCHVHECHARGCGGGIYAHSSQLDCGNVFFNGNRAEDAGAAFCAVQSEVQTSHFAGCWLQYGHGSTTGGHVQQQGGRLIMNYCRFLKAKMKDGGVIHLSDVQAEFANCLVYDNHSDGHTPGVIATNKSAVTLAHCTFADNTSKRKSSVDLWVENGSQAVVWNSILYSGDGTTVGKDSKSSLTARYSCLKGASDGLGVISSAPLFVNSGKTDYRLQPNSPCRDSGSNVAIAVTTKGSDAGEKRFISLQTDLDYKPRKVGSAVDMGAHEFQK